MADDEIVAVDFLGQEIRVGDIVLYPRMSGRSCEMTLARVERIDVVPQGRRTTTQAWEDWAAIRPWQDRPDERPEMYETVPAWRFSLMPLKSTRFRRYSWTDKQKPVYIQIGENVVKSPTTWEALP